MTAGGPELHDIWLYGFPVQLQARAEERHEELLREFVHIANTRDDAHIPQRLLALVAAARAHYGAFTSPVREEILEAREAGTETIDLRYRVPREGGELAERFLESLEAADQFCRSGDLLTLAASEELVRFRRWVFGEFLRQMDGLEPTPWPELADGSARVDGEEATR